MDEDDSHWCPWCGGEFRADVLVCPDCDVALGDGAATEGPGVEASGPPIDPAWASRLTVIAVACVAAVAAESIGAVIWALTLDVAGSSIPSTLLRHQRVRIILQLASPGMATIVLVAALSIAGARHLGATPRWAQRAVFGAAAALSGLAVAGAVADVVWDEGFGIIGGRAARLTSRVGALTLALCAAWLTEAWSRFTRDST